MGAKASSASIDGWAHASDPDADTVDGAAWRRQRLAEAQPVTDNKGSYRSDRLIGTDVLNPKGDDLGSVADRALNPQTGKIAYLVIGRGGVFGIDEKYVPVPGGHLQGDPGAGLLVLDSTECHGFCAGDVGRPVLRAWGFRRSKQDRRRLLDRARDKVSATG